jgi:hypothetical protein
MDMFDLGKDAEEKPSDTAEQPAEQSADAPPQQQTVLTGQYIIQNIIPMFSGWVAAYDDPDNEGGVIVFPIIALAMVLLQHPDGRAEQMVRHLVSTPAGQIDDINEFPNFICVVAPGQSPDAIVPAMKQMRDNAATAS